MPKYAYLRTDGRYDVYDVEPKIVTAAEYAKIKKRESLTAQREQLMASRSEIDAKIADTNKQLAALDAAPTESVGVTSSTANITNADTPAKRRW